MNPKSVFCACLTLLAGCVSSPPVETSSSSTPNRPTVAPRPPVSAGVFEPGPSLSDATFYIHDLGHRCVDFGARDSWAVGTPVYIYSCNGSIAQQVRVREINYLHDVQLGVESLFCIGVRGGQVAIDQPLELQLCDDASPAQRFAIDGDAILMGTETCEPVLALTRFQPPPLAASCGRVTRDFVIKRQRAYTPSRTPLVVGSREASDAEYFRFDAVDHSGARPTSGFISVSSETQLDWALSFGWGTVIEIDDQQPLELKSAFPKEVPEGVTVRGYRKYTYQGPEIFSCPGPPNDDSYTFHITQDNVRITGLRLRGPTSDPRCSNPTGAESQAIRIEPAALSPMQIWIDHLDISYWTGSAVDVRGPDFSPTCPAPPEFPRNTQVRVTGNFIHHIKKAYGAVTGQGGFMLAQANVFYGVHAHTVASDYKARTGYAAYDNLVLSRLLDLETHAFDVHGCFDPIHGNCSDPQTKGNYEGGIAGDYADMGWNTFLHTGHDNIRVRGTPCRFTAIHDSVFLQSQSAAIVTLTQNPRKHVVYANEFNAKNPMDNLAVGDFDGDRIDDVFVGTGAAWYFSSGAQAEWRFLNQMPEHADSLRFGDLDGDGRTDVIALHGPNIDVSWGGVSPWQTISTLPITSPITISDIAVGDFDGDGRADLFLATGTEWFWAQGGKTWISLGPSNDRRAQLLFGDFRHAGHTQILRIHQGYWELGEVINPPNGLYFTVLNGPAQTDSVDGLFVGDFDGTGFADEVARSNPQTGAWEYTRPTGFPSFQDWRPLTGANQVPLSQAVLGRFSGGPSTDIVVWTGNDLYVAPSGRGPLHQISRQDMR